MNDDRAGALGKDDRGSAVVEFVGVAVVALVPLMYLVLTVVEVQRTYFAVAAAAREAGRAIETAGSAERGAADAAAAVEMTLEDHGIARGRVSVHVASSPKRCGGDGAESAGLAAATSGSVVCVSAAVTLPGVPSVFDGGRNTVTGAYVVHLSPFQQR